MYDGDELPSEISNCAGLLVLQKLSTDSLVSNLDEISINFSALQLSDKSIGLSTQLVSLASVTSIGLSTDKYSSLPNSQPKSVELFLSDEFSNPVDSTVVLSRAQVPNVETVLSGTDSSVLLAFLDILGNSIAYTEIFCIEFQRLDFAQMTVFIN